MKAQTNRFARTRARQLRLDSTDCERLLWNRLRGGQVGVKFRRQHPFDRYILDFVCLERGVVVEVDGSQHGDRIEHDRRRTQVLLTAGLLVLRFTNHQVIEEIDAVLEVIHAATHPLPNPPLEGEGTSW